MFSARTSTTHSTVAHGSCCSRYRQPRRKEFLVQAILATEQTDRLEESIRKVVRAELQAASITDFCFKLSRQRMLYQTLRSIS